MKDGKKVQRISEFLLQMRQATLEIEKQLRSTAGDKASDDERERLFSRLGSMAKALSMLSDDVQDIGKEPDPQTEKLVDDVFYFIDEYIRLKEMKVDADIAKSFKNR